MSSRSSNSADGSLLPVGRVRGRRGAGGEITVRVPAGSPETWTQLAKVWIGGVSDPGRPIRVEEARAYADKLVLKLEGIDDAGAAEGLRGRMVRAERRDAPDLPRGTNYTALLVGLSVEDETGRELGRVADVVPTAGRDLLSVKRGTEAKGETGTELLIPMTREIILDIDEQAGRIRVRLPEGLEELDA